MTLAAQLDDVVFAFMCCMAVGAFAFGCWWLVRSVSAVTLRRLGRYLYRRSQRASAHCSFCGKHYREAGPFCEGFDGGMICAKCAHFCVEIIDAEIARREQSACAADPNATAAGYIDTHEVADEPGSAILPES